jgi:hypothetical protein
MSGRIDTPLAIPTPPRGAEARASRLARAAHNASRTVWLSDPIDLRLVVDRLELTDPKASESPGSRVGADEIARQLRAPRNRR